VKNYDAAGHKYNSLRLKVWIDFMLRIKAAAGSQIDFEKIRDLVFYFKANGFNIVRITYDQYQSTDSLQIFHKAKLESKELSVDKTRKPYDALRAAVQEARLDFYAYPHFERELFDLVDKGKKIDHPATGEDGYPGSKDVTDSLAGVVGSLLLKEGTEHSSIIDLPEGILRQEPKDIYREPTLEELVREDAANELEPAVSTLDSLFDDEEPK